MASGKKLKLAINVSAEQVDHDRDEYQVNSPKPDQAQSQDKSDNLNQAKKIPYDKARDDLGLNSPTGPDQKYEASYGSAQQNSGPPADLITSVSRPEEKSSNKPQALITQIDQPTVTKKTKKKSNKSKGWCS